MVERIFESILGLSVMGSVMILIVFLLKAILWRQKGSVKKMAFVVMWMLVFLRLCVPFTMESKFFDERVNPTQLVYQAVMPDPSTRNETGLQGSDLMNFNEFQDANATENGMAAGNPQQEKTVQNNKLSLHGVNILSLAAKVWLVITLLFFTTIMIAYRVVLHKINTLQRVEYINFASLKEKVGVKQRVILRQSYGEVGTAVYGILRPTIVLSKQNAEDEDGLQHVLLHELVHIKRKDNLKKLFAQVILTIHWFNPFVWLGRHLLEKDIELACDEKVITLLGYEERKAYAQSLFVFAMQHRSYGSGSFASFGQNPVKGRVKNILVLKKKSIMRPVIAFAVILFLVMGCMSNPISQLSKMAAYAMEPRFTDIPLGVNNAAAENLTITDYYATEDVIYCILAPDVAEGEIPYGYQLAAFDPKTQTMRILHEALTEGEYASGLHYAAGDLYFCLNQSPGRPVENTAIVKYNLKNGLLSEIFWPYAAARVNEKIEIAPQQLAYAEIRLRGDDQYLCWHEIYENAAGEIQDTLVLWDLTAGFVTDEISGNGRQNYGDILDGYIGYQKTDEEGNTYLVRRLIKTGEELTVKNILPGEPYSVYANENYLVYKEDFKPGADIVYYDVKAKKSYQLWDALENKLSAQKLNIYQNGTWGINLAKDYLILTGASNTILEVNLQDLTVSEVYDSNNLQTGFYRTKSQPQAVGSLQYLKEQNGTISHRIFLGSFVEEEK